MLKVIIFDFVGVLFDENAIHEDTIVLIKKFSSKYKLGIGSSASSDLIHKILKIYKIDNYFECVVGSEDCSYSKPNPEVYSKALGKLNVQPNEAIVIDDSEVGIIAAKKAGIYAIKLGTEQGTSIADKSISTLADLDIDKIFFNVDDQELIDIIDENENILFKTTKDKAHTDGLLHKEVHVWVYKKIEKEVLVQVRKSGYRDASAGGHVPTGGTEKYAAIMEMQEEIGLNANSEKLELVTKFRLQQTHPTKLNFINNVLRTIFIYELTDEIIKPNFNEILNIEMWSINRILNLENNPDPQFIANMGIKWLDFRKIFGLIENRMNR